jgi:hypothetical protein
VIRGTPDLWSSPGAAGGEGRSTDSIEFDNRSLAEVAFEQTGNFEVEQVHQARARAPRPSPPTPARTVPGRRAGHPGADGSFQPQALRRPVKERTRPGGGPFSEVTPRSGDAPHAPSLQQKAELLYKEALKEVAVGNLGAARRHLQLALSFSPGDARFERALHGLGGSPK